MKASSPQLTNDRAKTELTPALDTGPQKTS